MAGACSYGFVSKQGTQEHPGGILQSNFEKATLLQEARPSPIVRVGRLQQHLVAILKMNHVSSGVMLKGVYQKLFTRPLALTEQLFAQLRESLGLGSPIDFLCKGEKVEGPQFWMDHLGSTRTALLVYDVKETNLG